MQAQNKIIWLFVLLALIFIAVYASKSENSGEKNGETVKIGFIGPLSGFAAAWGEEMRDVVEIAREEINTSGGVNGQALEIIYEDGKCGPKDALSAAQKLITVNKVKILLVICGQEALAVAPVAERNQVLMMSMWATHPDLTGAGEFIFRNSYSDDDTGRVMAETINKKYGKVAVITETSDFTVGLLKAFKKYFQGEVIEENYPPGTTDFRGYVLDVISKKPETVVMNPNAPLGGISALRQLRQLGYKGPIYGNYFGELEEVIEISEAEGMIFFADPNVGNNQIKSELFHKFESLYGRAPTIKFADAVTYDSVYMIKQAIDNVGLDNSKLKDYLHSLKDFKGVMGTYGFDENGDAIGLLPTVKQIVNGKAVLYTQP
ncbi:MAG: ABC transporter substrate-binding protein [Patescibacteria group bacterium]